MTHNVVPESEARPSLDIESASPIRIVVADDQPIFRDALCQLLASEEGLRVIGQAGDGRGALELVARHAPEILLLDLNMPGLDGRQVLEELRRRKTQTRTIVLTASEERDDLLQALQLGAAGVVLKHEPTDTLIKSIRRVHAGEIWVNPAAAAATRSSPGPHGWPSQQPLTLQEVRVVRLVATGLRNKDIAGRMRISEQTVKNHLRNIFAKLQVKDRLELALFAMNHGIDA